MNLLLLMLAAAAPPAANCDEPVTQADMNICSYRDYQVADGELNMVWTKAVAAMKAQDRALDRRNDKRPGYFDTLLAGQRAWLTYRDMQCRVEGFQMRGGSAEAMLVNGCLTTLTEVRVRELQTLVDGN